MFVPGLLVPGFSIIGLAWLALLCACTLVTRLLESPADARLPIPPATNWPWAGDQKF